MLLAPHDLRPPRGLPAREPSAPRAFGSARRLEARPGPAGPVAASNRAGLGARVLALAPPPPTGTAARPTNPSGALHTGGTVSLCVSGASARSPARPRCRPRPPQLGPPIPLAASTPAALCRCALLARSPLPPSNVARNSAETISEVELYSLVFQCF